MQTFCRTLLPVLLLALPATLEAQFTYTSNNGTITITGYNGPGGDVTIPSTINGLPVTSVGDSAFDPGCSGNQFSSPMTSVTIPNTIISIGNGGFEYCWCLTSITIPTSVTSLGAWMLHGCVNLTSVTIPNSITNIGDAAFCGCHSLTTVTIPDRVTYIGYAMFYDCPSLTKVKMGSSVTNIGEAALALCYSLTDITIPDSVASIGRAAFGSCHSLNHLTLGDGVTAIGNQAFEDCSMLAAVYFTGNAPQTTGTNIFSGDGNVIVYYVPGTTGWGTTYGGCPTAHWNPLAIQRSPQTQTAEANSAITLWVQASGSSPLCCLWYLNYTNLISWSTNWDLELTNVQFARLELTNVQFAQSGVYTAVITNVAGVITSSPALLNVIAAVERRPVPGVKVTGETGSLLNVDYASSLSPSANWTTLVSVSLTSTSQYCFDLTLPLPPQRFYRAWQTGTPGVMPSLSLPGMVPALTLRGNIGGSVHLDYINRFGPIDAWATLDTVTLTNTSQLYFDVSAPGQPQRLYRLVPSP
jgi:hypothetical protein